MLYDCEGEIGDNLHPGIHWSGDDGAWVFGILISCAGTQAGSGGDDDRYDQAPRSNSATLYTAFVHKGATLSMPAWLSWCQGSWPAMYTFLDGLDSDDRDKVKTSCQKKLAEAQAFKDAGYLT